MAAQEAGEAVALAAEEPLVLVAAGPDRLLAVPQRGAVEAVGPTVGAQGAAVPETGLRRAAPVLSGERVVRIRMGSSGRAVKAGVACTPWARERMPLPSTPPV